MGDLYEFEHVDAFTTGAMGLPGQRTFFVQVRSDGRRVTLKCEKQQVDALTQYLQRLLSDLPVPSDRPLPQSLELVHPLDPVAFVVGPMGLAYDRELDRFVLMIEEFVAPDPDADDPDDPDDPDAGGAESDAVEDRARVRIHLTRGQALAFAEHGEEIVAAGRPNCQWCGSPMDPDGHGCPRMN